MILYGVRKILAETPHGVFEGKSDQKKTQNAITEAKSASDNQTNAGINATQQRLGDVQARSDTERGATWDNFQNASGGGMISQADKDRLRYGSGGQGGSSGGGGGGGQPAALPDYLNTWKEMMGKNGGFDDTRLGSLNDTAGKLKNTSTQYGDTDTSVHGLQDFAKSGGVSDANISDIKNNTLRELADTGGYSAADKGNIRARSNAGVSSIYNNMKDSMTRGGIGGPVNPAMSAAGFKLARQSAQDQGTNMRNTEADIAEKVRQGRMEGASKLSDASLGLSTLQSGNTLSGYGKSGDLANTKQSQIDKAMNDSGQLELGTQGTINDARLRSAQGTSSDTLGRMSIGASSAAAAASRADANERFLMEMDQQGKMFGGQGMLDTYKASPGELGHDEDLLRGYRQDQFGNNNDLINDRVSASRIPGIGSTIGAGLDNVMKVGKIATGVGFIPGMSGGSGNTGVAGGSTNNVLRGTY